MPSATTTSYQHLVLNFGLLSTHLVCWASSLASLAFWHTFSQYLWIIRSFSSILCNPLRSSWSKQKRCLTALFSSLQQLDLWFWRILSSSRTRMEAAEKCFVTRHQCRGGTWATQSQAFASTVVCVGCRKASHSATFASSGTSDQRYRCDSLKRLTHYISVLKVRKVS